MALCDHVEHAEVVVAEYLCLFTRRNKKGFKIWSKNISHPMISSLLHQPYNHKRILLNVKKRPFKIKCQSYNKLNISGSFQGVHCVYLNLEQSAAWFFFLSWSLNLTFLHMYVIMHMKARCKIWNICVSPCLSSLTWSIIYYSEHLIISHLFCLIFNMKGNSEADNETATV